MLGVYNTPTSPVIVIQKQTRIWAERIKFPKSTEHNNAQLRVYDARRQLLVALTSETSDWQDPY